MPYQTFQDGIYSAAPDTMDEETEEQRAARLLRERGARPPAAFDLSSAPTTPDAAPPGLTSPEVIRPSEQPPAPPLPTLAQDRLARPVPGQLPQQLQDKLTVTRSPGVQTNLNTTPDERANIKGQFAPDDNTPIMRPTEQLRKELTAAPVVAPTQAPSAISATQPSAPIAPARRLPVSVRDEVGPMPDRGADRYRYTGHGPVGRLKAGFSNIANAPPIQASGGSPGMVAGEALGGLLGRFIGGAARPGSAGEYKYQKDLALWQQRQEAASKAATEESNRGDAYMRATGLDLDGNPLPGTVTKRMAATAQASRANTYALKANTDIDKLKETTRNHILRALQGGAFVPTPEDERALEAQGLRFVGAPQKGGSTLGKIEQKGVNEKGDPVTRYFVWDRRTGGVRPMTNDDGSVIEVPGHGNWGVQVGRPQTETATPATAGVATRPGVEMAPSEPFTLQNVPQKGAGNWGEFHTPDELIRNLYADRSTWENHSTALGRARAELERLAREREEMSAVTGESTKRTLEGKEVTEILSNEPDANDPFQAAKRKAWEAKAARNEKAQEHQRDIIGKSEDGLGKATADVIRRYGPYGLKWKVPGDPSQGWHAKAVEDFVRKQALDATTPADHSKYPIGGQKTWKTGRIPGHKVGPGTMFPNSQ